MKNNTLTKKLLTCGMLAGPVYVGLWMLQIFIREGYDPTRHDLSLLSNGDLGWIQITNFLVSGFLVILGAVGFHRAMQKGKGRIVGPLLLGLATTSLMLWRKSFVPGWVLHTVCNFLGPFLASQAPAIYHELRLFFL